MDCLTEESGVWQELNQTYRREKNRKDITLGRCMVRVVSSEVWSLQDAQETGIDEKVCRRLLYREEK